MSSPTVKINTGADVPILGIGVFTGFELDGTYEMIREALKVGYRHIDTAAAYKTEQLVGKAIRESGVPREEVFLVTKLDNGDHGRVTDAFNDSLSALGLDYIDLYLMHWPFSTGSDGKAIPIDQSPTFVDTWKEMEKLVEGGKCKAIGVSNFSVKNLEILLKEAKIVPAANQVESHIYFPQPTLTSYCLSKNILLTAYSPLGGQPRDKSASKVLEEEELERIGKKYGRSKGAVALSWIVQRKGWSAIPKSSNPERMKDNLNIFTLDQEDFDALSAVHKQPGKTLRTCPGDWKENGIAGWWEEEMGWSKEGDY